MAKFTSRNRWPKQGCELSSASGQILTGIAECYGAAVIEYLKPICLLALIAGHLLSGAISFGQYIRTGHNEDAPTTPIAGFALMGGGSDLEPAFKWLCDRARGGDFLILRARGDDAYNSYINGLCHANSVATLIIPDATAARDPRVAEIIRNAEAIFISGGDQARYIKGWMDSPVQRELNDAIARGVPIGGTSAGLAVLGDYVYSAENDKPNEPNLSSNQALADPFNNRVKVRREFLQIPLFRHVLTDTHFKARDRMGRTITFLARIVEDGWSRNPHAIAVDEKTTVLVDGNGKASVVGSSSAYFLSVNELPKVCVSGMPLTFNNISVYRLKAGGRFDVSNWRGDGGVAYSVSAEQGVIHSSQPGGAIY
ncbi:MAG TPA: cyanophycinase [Terriglobales bacterium]|nr:cyanophycinase [Terriglobales bacterium]